MSQLFKCPIDFVQEDVFSYIEISVHLGFLKSSTRKEACVSSDAVELKCFFEQKNEQSMR